jgi:hypothetical protein
MNSKDLTADIIKICAVITAMPRWVGALLAAEGIMIPEQWRGWWIVASAIFNAAMAVTEGLAFAYVFNAWRNQKDKNADRLLWLAIASGATFVIVLAPFIAAQVRSVTLAAMLSADWALWAWSGSVAASTIIIVASVGYAQKRSLPETASKKSVKSEVQPATSEVEPVVSQPAAGLASFACQLCPATFASPQALNAHQRAHASKIASIELALPASGNGSVTR